MDVGENRGLGDSAEFSQCAGRGDLASPERVPQPIEVAKRPGKGAGFASRRCAGTAFDRYIDGQVHGEVCHVQASVVGEPVASCQPGVQLDEAAVLCPRPDHELRETHSGVAQMSHQGGQLLPESDADRAGARGNPEARPVSSVRPDGHRLHHVEQLAVFGCEEEVVARPLRQALNQEPVVAGGPYRELPGKVIAIEAADHLASVQQPRMWPQGLHHHGRGHSLGGSEQLLIAMDDLPPRHRKAGRLGGLQAALLVHARVDRLGRRQRQRGSLGQPPALACQEHEGDVVERKDMDRLGASGQLAYEGVEENGWFVPNRRVVPHSAGVSAQLDPPRSLSVSSIGISAHHRTPAAPGQGAHDRHCRPVGAQHQDRLRRSRGP